MKKLAAVGAALVSSVTFVGPSSVSAAANPGTIVVSYNGQSHVYELSATAVVATVGDTIQVNNTTQDPINVGTDVGANAGILSVGQQACNPLQTQATCNVASGNTTTYTVTQLGVITVRFSNASKLTFTVGAGGGSSGPATVVKASFDPNGGECIFDGVKKVVKHDSFTVGFAYAPSATECTRQGYAFKYWSKKGETTPSDLPLLNNDGVKRYFVAQGGDYVAQWEGWVDDGVQKGPVLCVATISASSCFQGGLGSSVSLSGDGNVVAGGGLFASTRAYRRQPGGSWSGPMNELLRTTLISNVALSGDGSTLMHTWGIAAFGGGASVAYGDAVLRSTFYSPVASLVPAEPSEVGIRSAVFTGLAVASNRDGSRYAVGGRLGGSRFSGGVTVYSPDLAAGSKSLEGEAQADGFGSSVAMSADGDTLVVGAPLNDGAGIDAGSVRVYRRSGGSMTQVGSDIDGEAPGDQFGSSVAVSSNGNTVVVGAPFNDGAGTDAGHVRVFDLKNGAWVQRGSDIDGAVAGGRAGYSVAASGDGNSVVYGSPYAAMPDWNVQRQFGARCNFDGGILEFVSKFVLDLLYACDGLEGGRADVRRWSTDSWTPVGLPIPGDSRRRVGYSVDMSDDGTVVVLGAPGVSWPLDVFYSGELREYRLTS